MRHIISARHAVRILALSLTATLAQVPAHAADAAPLELAANAPERHIVVPGDTLWDISAKFLKQPYRWPELWRLNADDIKNPHRIYPGQVLVLEKDADGRPRLRVAGAGGSDSGAGREIKVEPKIYVEPQKKEISTIPYSLIQPYLARPLVMDVPALNRLPRIVSAENDRVLIGSGDKVFATGINNRNLVWHIYRPGDALKEPGSREVLGHEAIYVGSARLIAEGEPATLQITRSTLEILRGDRLIAETEPAVLSYAPRAGIAGISGRILTVYGAVGSGGKYSVVSFSRGTRDGIEIGQVFELARAGLKVDERFNGTKRTHITPDQRTGMVFVFQAFDRVSYALVMNSDDPIVVGDIVRSPD